MTKQEGKKKTISVYNKKIIIDKINILKLNWQSRNKNINKKYEFQKTKWINQWKHCLETHKEHYQYKKVNQQIYKKKKKNMNTTKKIIMNKSINKPYIRTKDQLFTQTKK